MFEIRKLARGMGRFSVLFSGSFLGAVMFFKNLSVEDKKDCFYAYVGDGTEGV